MDTAGKSAEQLREQISKAEAELTALREQLARVESQQQQQQQQHIDGAATAWKWPLSADEYDRYGRQLVLPDFGINGQKRLKAARILIVGAGGLGCPAAAYIAGAGVGTLGIVDGDVVEPSNLHRQIAHATSRVGMHKVDSLVAYCKELNPLPTYTPYRHHLTPQNAEAVVRNYDLVLDCTDHPSSRYLISDACVLLRKPLVSASALRTDGQLIVLNTPPAPPGSTRRAPCYRCVFPRPPPPAAVVSCGEGGVLGPVVGLMGVLQALEALKIAAAAGLPLDDADGGASPPPPPPPTLLLFNSGAALGAPSFRAVRMRGARTDCVACGAAAALSSASLRAGDYAAFCGAPGVEQESTTLTLGADERVSAREYRDAVVAPRRRVVLLDVREKELFDVASIEGAVNVPFSRIQRCCCSSASPAGQADGVVMPDWLPPELADDDDDDDDDAAATTPVYVVCRVGNDSQVVARRLKDLGLGRGGARWIGDIKGGMRAWRDEVDGTLPFL